MSYNISIDLLALTIVSLHSSAHAQLADLVLCGRLAANPIDASIARISSDGPNWIAFFSDRCSIIRPILGNADSGRD
jgi:hypothetical protein